MKTNIYVIYGGKSVEHDVSLSSAFSVINSLDKNKYNIYLVYITKSGVWCDLGRLKTNLKDIEQLQSSSSATVTSSLGDFLSKNFKKNEKSIVFPVLHGTYGEDGTIQGLFEMLNIPYVGNGVLSSAAGIDKVVMKDIFSLGNIPQAKYTSTKLHSWKTDEEQVYKQVEDLIGYPCFVKPAKLGSSVGINRCGNRDQLKEAIKEAFLYDSKIIIEEELIGREMQIAVIGNDCPKASVVGEYIQERQFMDYAAKYVDGKLVPIIPARLSTEISEVMRETAIQAFKLINCCGLVRVDYFVTDENKFYVNEVNTLPGFTAYSMFPALWEKTDGTTYAELIEILIKLGFCMHKQKNSILSMRWEK
ncbi:D-alanine--D-alanine ligase [Proteiniborus sp. MB09-C3]|uniref:D-alanine--D-alanine ligase n=1 Tax=Proteiniborus sp. MB09-C3 TaxID=3050072 RepID=UPI0025533F74|nr:D-alanine--D-alanine ligase [Proteiniborus sp. MB09-C3]WIV12767.1 D-alanine--D-alanine ligase [Proteiniborus sp. MB09-C3]